MMPAKDEEEGRERERGEREERERAQQHRPYRKWAKAGLPNTGTQAKDGKREEHELGLLLVVRSRPERMDHGAVSCGGWTERGRANGTAAADADMVQTQAPPKKGG